MWFGLVFDRLAVLKKKVWANYKDSFFMFSGAKKEFLFWKCCIVSIWEKIFKEKYLSPKTRKKPPSNRAKFTINSVLLYWRHLPARLLYNDFDYKHNFSFSFQLCCMCQARRRKVLHRIYCKYIQHYFLTFLGCF